VGSSPSIGSRKPSLKKWWFFVFRNGSFEIPLTKKFGSTRGSGKPSLKKWWFFVFRNDDLIFLNEQKVNVGGTRGHD
jgi:hypothetical protein